MEKDCESGCNLFSYFEGKDKQGERALIIVLYKNRDIYSACHIVDNNFLFN